MAATKLPDPLKRRHLIEEDMPAAKALALAEAYLADDRRVEALDFLAKAEALDRLAALREIAIEEGDVFLLREVARRLDDEPDADAWRRLAEAARGLGKDRDAHEADRLAAARR